MYKKVEIVKGGVHTGLLQMGIAVSYAYMYMCTWKVNHNVEVHSYEVHVT